MPTEDRGMEPASDLDRAIERALEAANLRAGDATSTAAVVVEDREPSSAEAGAGAGAGTAGGDGD